MRAAGGDPLLPPGSASPAALPTFDAMVAVASLDAAAGWYAPLTIASMCAPHNQKWTVICAEAKGNHRAYAQRHGYGLRFHSKELPTGREDSWSKLPIIASVLRTAGVRTAFWMDSDALFMRQGVPLDVLLPPRGSDLAFPPDAVVSVNAGHISLRRSLTSTDFLRAVWSVYPEPPEPRIWWEQSAVAYVLGGEEPACRADVVCNVCTRLASGNPPSSCAGRNCSKRLGGRFAQRTHIFPAHWMSQDIYTFEQNNRSGQVLHFAGMGDDVKARLMRKWARFAALPNNTALVDFVAGRPSAAVTRSVKGVAALTARPRGAAISISRGVDVEQQQGAAGGLGPSFCGMPE
jgi:hypothetical protein